VGKWQTGCRETDKKESAIASEALLSVRVVVQLWMEERGSWAGFRPRGRKGEGGVISLPVIPLIFIVFFILESKKDSWKEGLGEELRQMIRGTTVPA